MAELTILSRFEIRFLPLILLAAACGTPEDAPADAGQYARASQEIHRFTTREEAAEALDVVDRALASANERLAAFEATMAEALAACRSGICSTAISTRHGRLIMARGLAASDEQIVYWRCGDYDQDRKIGIDDFRYWRDCERRTDYQYFVSAAGDVKKYGRSRPPECSLYGRIANSSDLIKCWGLR